MQQHTTLTCKTLISLTSKVLGSNGKSEGRSILGFSSGSGLGLDGVAARQGNGGPSLGWASAEGDFLIEGSFLGAICGLP